MKRIFFIIFIFQFLFAGYNDKILKQLKSNTTKFSFVVMGDNRDGDDILKEIISQTNQNQSISFLIDNGDLVRHGYKYEFKNYIQLIKTSNKPIISVIGNHEIPWYDGKNNYKKFIGKPYFSFSYGNSYFIILDTSTEDISKKQFKWLKKELKKSKNYTHCFVFMHTPLYDPRKGYYTKGHSLQNLDTVKKLNSLFDKYKISMLFCSHIHLYFRGNWHKTPYIITGGAGAPLKKNGFYHYIKVVVNKNKVSYEVIPIKRDYD